MRRDRPNPRLHASRDVDASGEKRKRGAGADMSTGGFGSQSGSGKRVFVGNLPFETTWQDLKDVFKSVGPVAHVEILTGPGGRSKGAATVEFVTAMGATKAIAKFNAAEVNGRSIVVRMDREAGVIKRVKHNVNSPGLTVTPAGGGPRIGGAPGTTLYVGNVPYEASWQNLVSWVGELCC